MCTKAPYRHRIAQPGRICTNEIVFPVFPCTTRLSIIAEFVRMRLFFQYSHVIVTDVTSNNNSRQKKIMEQIRKLKFKILKNLYILYKTLQYFIISFKISAQIISVVTTLKRKSCDLNY